MNLDEAELYLNEHLKEIGDRVNDGDPLCTVLVLLMEIYSEDPGNQELTGVLIQAVEEHRGRCAVEAAAPGKTVLN